MVVVLFTDLKNIKNLKTRFNNKQRKIAKLKITSAAAQLALSENFSFPTQYTSQLVLLLDNRWRYQSPSYRYLKVKVVQCEIIGRHYGC